MNKVQELIAALQKIQDDDAVEEAQYLTDGYMDELPESVQNAVGLACEALIANEGHCNWDAMAELKKAGFPVYAGETDDFGWLSGVIATSKGNLVYG